MCKWLFAAMLLGTAFTAQAAPAPSAPCTAPEYWQLDFWLGDWDTFDMGEKGPSVARNRVTSILHGCVIHEHYQQNDGLTGESFSIYDASWQVWHQTWVTNRGVLLILEGRFKDGALTLEGSSLGKDDRPVLIRGTWKVQGNSVRETAYSSKDGGKTWDMEFDILFKPHR